ncbi:unnamed protein product [Pleuronectes platessa]|uniref:Uncharacterized protein n=1 Tax=Pleuronectes platessa TaxID=8262 RepID=A0A9N7U8B8_PLEPL|nr:unnamed protein product [Pleuronectes platessa]
MMESMQAAGAESRELEKYDIADYQQAADDQQAEASSFPPVEIKADEKNLWPHLSKQFAFKPKRGNSYIMLKLDKKLCEWQGAWLVPGCSRRGTPALNSPHHPLIKAWSAHHYGARLFCLVRPSVCLAALLFILVSSWISEPASTLPPQPASAFHSNKLCSLILNNLSASALGSNLTTKPNNNLFRIEFLLNLEIKLEKLISQRYGVENGSNVQIALLARMGKLLSSR